MRAFKKALGFLAAAFALAFFASALYALWVDEGLTLHGKLAFSCIAGVVLTFIPWVILDERLK